MPFEADCPVIVGGVTITPGDYIYADASGAVIPPATRVVQILAEATRIEQNDAELIKHIRDEDRERVLKNGSGDSWHSRFVARCETSIWPDRPS